MLYLLWYYGIMVLYGILVSWYHGIMVLCIVYKLCLPVGVPAGAFFLQKVHFLNLGVLLYQRNEHIGTIGTK